VEGFFIRPIALAMGVHFVYPWPSDGKKPRPPYLRWMKRYIFLLAVLFACGICAQTPLTVQFAVTGSVEKESTLSITDIASQPHTELGDLPIVNHSGEQVSTAKKAKGVLLKDVLKNVVITSPSGRELSSFYILCTASDGYAVTFSWNEVFNSNDVYVLIEVDGVPIGEYGKSIQLFHTRDLQSGRRFLRGLSTVEIKKG
jgi:hypothetical protein